MERLTSRNPDNSITVTTVSGKELLHHLAECEDRLERIEKCLEYLMKNREISFFKHSRTPYEISKSYYNGMYAAFQKSIETVKRAMEGKRYGK